MTNYSFVLDTDGKPLSPTQHCKKVNAKKCKLLWKYSKIYWLDNVA